MKRVWYTWLRLCCEFIISTESRTFPRLRWRSALKQPARLLALTLLALLVHGYHLGLEDQAIYLPAIKKNLAANLYPHDAEFFLAQARPSLFDELIATSARITHLPLEVAVLLWHMLSIFLILLACLRLARRCFASASGEWAAVVMVTVFLTLPVTGTRLYVVDQYLHPRALATAAILFMLGEALDGKLLRCAAWTFLAALMHVQMAFYGALLAVFFLLPHSWFFPKRGAVQAAPAVGALFPLVALLQTPPDAWLEAARTRSSHYLLRWQWYEWLGIFAPLALLWWFSGKKNAGRTRQEEMRSSICRRVAVFGVFIFIAAAICTIPAALERFTPLQPMRGYHLIYLFLLLIGGGLLGEFVLQGRVWRWVVVFMPLALIMFYAQRELLPASPHIEFPGSAPVNRWQQAFIWIRQNTPSDAYFALDPNYIELPEEDAHGFRALAERSMMADYIKDSGVALLFPALAQRWQKEVHARAGWKTFQYRDFERLQKDFGVTWLVLEGPPAVKGLSCPYHNGPLRVCRMGE